MNDDCIALEDALATIEQLRERNQELATQVMRLQGQSRQITDIEVRDRFSNLYDAIRAWTQSYVRDLLQDGWTTRQFQQELRNEKGRAWLVDMMRRHNTERAGNADYLDEDWADWLANQGSCVHVILNLLLWARLKGEIFDPELPPGLSEYKGVRTAMYDLMRIIEESDAGAAAARKWRAYTIETMYGAPGPWEKERGFLEVFMDGLAETMPLRILRPLSASHRASLRSNILDPAAALQRDLACSLFKYHVQEPPHQRGKIYRTSRLRAWNLQSVTQWIPVSSDDEVQGVFCCLYPRIFRAHPGSEEEIEVLQPTMLVYDNSGPLPRAPTRAKTYPLPEPAASKRLLERSASDLHCLPSASESPERYSDDHKHDRRYRRRRSMPMSGTSAPTGRSTTPPDTTARSGSTFRSWSKQAFKAWVLPLSPKQSRGRSEHAGPRYGRPDTAHPPLPASFQGVQCETAKAEQSQLMQDVGYAREEINRPQRASEYANDDRIMRRDIREARYEKDDRDSAHHHRRRSARAHDSSAAMDGYDQLNDPTYRAPQTALVYSQGLWEPEVK